MAWKSVAAILAASSIGVYCGVTVFWVEHCLARDSVPSCGGNMEEPGAVMIIRGAEVPIVNRSGSPAGSFFWWI